MWTHTVALLAVFSTLAEVTGSGVFEVLLTSLSNDRGMTSHGKCCDTGRDDRCLEQCHTFVTVCLSHYQNKVVRSYPSCTFGQFATPLLGGNNVDLREETGDGPYTIKLPFTFSWPESFTLIIEVWHDQFGNRSITEEKLILKVQRTDSLRPSHTWVGQQEGNRHAELTFAYRVLCDHNYYGVSCDRLCRPRDDRFGHYTCSSNGTKLCLEGWRGRFCDEALCHERCSPSRGFCDSPTECRCRVGWRGEFCEDCIQSPDCRYGYCHQPWQCICNHGWAGINCDIDTGYCEKHRPCHNGGTCIGNWVQNYTCECPRGFGGKRCEREVCLPATCHNGGLCQESRSSVSCLCPDGFTGQRCEIQLPSCDGVTCRNNGSCVLEVSGPRCVCIPGFSGQACQQDDRRCSSAPCRNGGTCTEETGGGFRCECRTGFRGSFCQAGEELCGTKRCHNGGSCILHNGEAKCRCPRGFRGHSCQHKVSSCSPSVCANGGSCEVTGTRWHCSCREGFKGKTCRVVSSSCRQRLPDGRCKCSTGDHGQRCSPVHNSSEPVPASIEYPPPAAVISAASTVMTRLTAIIIITAMCRFIGLAL